MSRRPAKMIQADIVRAIRAAKQAGAGGVEIKPDGTIKVILSPPSTPDQFTVEDQREIVL